MSLHHPKSLKRYEYYRQKDQLVIIKYGAEWCGPCQQITPLMEQLALKNPDIYFLDVSIDNEELFQHPDLKNVRNIPHFKFFLKGKLVEEFVKADKDRLKKYTKRHSKPKLKPKPELTTKTKSTKPLTRIDLFDTPTDSDERLYVDYYLDNHEKNIKYLN